jgi:hypothetical protein
VGVMCCQVERSGTGRSLVQTECGVSECYRGTSQRRSAPNTAVEPYKKSSVINTAVGSAE